MAQCNYWLMKSEPDVYSLDDLKRDGTTYWEGVRNYQARNLMRSMAVGDGIIYYHSNAQPPGAVGLARVTRTAYPDPHQFDEGHKYYDAKSTKEKPRWDVVDIEYLAHFDHLLPLAELRERPDLEGMALLRKGQRLSVQPVSEKEWKILCKLGGVSPSLP